MAEHGPGGQAAADGQSLRSEARLQAFVDSVFDAYYDWHITTGYMEFSARMDSLLGLPAGGLRRAFSAWCGRLHPDDRERTLARVERCVQSGDVFESDYRLVRADGSYVWARDRGVVFTDAQGRATHMVGAIRDVSQERAAHQALREAAEIYHTLFEYAVNPSYHVTEDGCFADANEAGSAFLEIAREDLLGEPVDMWWGREAKEAALATTRSDGVVTTLELQLDIGGTAKALALTLVPCRIRDSSSCFALGTDITEHHALRRRLEESEESLRLQATALEDTNTALRVILDQRSRDRTELEHTIVANMEAMILPLLGQLERRLASTPEAVYIDALGRSVREITHPFARSLNAPGRASSPLTPREREIAGLIRAGKSTGEIAEALYLSPGTVTFHRKNLRKKLGVPPRGPQLHTWLAQIGEAPETDGPSSPNARPSQD